MNIGDIILIPFPFAELTNKKVRPAVVITETADKFKDYTYRISPDSKAYREQIETM